MLGPNHVLVTLRRDDGRSPSQEKIQTITGSVKTKNYVFQNCIFKIGQSHWVSQGLRNWVHARTVMSVHATYTQRAFSVHETTCT